MPLTQPDIEATDSFVEAVDGLSLDELSVEAFTQSRQAICITDADLDEPGPIITFVNQAYADIFGCAPADVLGRTPRIGQGPLTNRHVLDRVRKHLELGEALQAQVINYRLNRETFRLRWSIDPVRRNGEVVGFMALLYDVTDQDRMRRRLTALDTMMSRGKAVATMPAADRDATVADALVGSLRPILAEIGTATVTIGDVRRTTDTGATFTLPVGSTMHHFAVTAGSRCGIEVDTHPDADPLVDRVAINELTEHANWLLGLGDPT